MLLFKFLIGALFLGLTLSKELADNELCFSAVYGAYNSITFAGPPNQDYWTTLCQNPLKVLSIYASARLRCKPEEIRPGAAVLEGYCLERASKPLLPMSDFAANLTDQSIAKFRVIEKGEIPRKEIVKSPLVISKKLYDLSLRTIVVSAFETRTHHQYGFAIYGIWGVILLFGMLRNFCTWIFFTPMTKQKDDLENSRTKQLKSPSGILSPLYHFSSWVQIHLTLPFFASYRSRVLGGDDLPTRLEAMVIFSYFVIVTVLCCVNYELFVGNLYWSATNIQLARYIADRTGILAFANLPLIWLFAGRNNIFMWATGWNFRTFNIFHRQVSIVATILAIVHSITYTVYYFINGKSESYKASFKEKWFYSGVIGTVAMSFLLLSSNLALRKKSYEVFLLVHIVLSVVTIVGLFFHVSIFEGEYNPYLWPLVAIWSFDRALRLARIAYCNFRVRFGGKGLQRTTAVASYDSTSDIIRLEVIPAATGISQKPGRYYFLYQPFRWTGYENHPFTLGAWVEKSNATGELNEQLHTPSTSSFDKKEEKYPVNSAVREVGSCEDRSKEIRYIFWIRPLSGWTRQLRQQCIQAGGTSISTSMLLEGPYGERSPLWAFESVLLIVGGTGIAAAVPYIQDHIRRMSPTGTGACTLSIKLVWSSRQASFIHEVASRELRPAFGREDIQFSFHSTSAGDKSLATTPPPVKLDEISPIETPSASGSESSSQNGTTDGPQYEIKTGRPDIKSMVLNSAASTNAANSRLAVLICGPVAMADETREAVHAALLQGYKRIEYIEDTYSW